MPQASVRKRRRRPTRTRTRTRIVATTFDNQRPELAELAVLQQRVNDLLPQQEKLERKIDRLVAKILRTRDTLFDSGRRSTIPFAVCHFVAAIERANLYFDFKDAAIKKHAPNLINSPMLSSQITNLLRDDKMLQSKFHNIGELELRQTAAAIFFELSDERRRLKQQEGFEKREDRALRHPIYDLVFRARHQAVVMDEDPELELKKIMKSDPCFYDGHLRPKEPLVEHARLEARKSYAEFWSKYVKSASDAEPCAENVEDAGLENVEDMGSVLPFFKTDLPCVLHTGSREEFGLVSAGSPEDFGLVSAGSREEFGLKKKLQTLEQIMGELMQRKKEREEQLTDLLVQCTEKRNTFFEWKRRSGLQSAVIHFVAAIEKANLYFDFKKAAIDKCRPELLKRPQGPFQIFDTLCKDETLMSKFDKVGKVEIRQAAMAIFVELCDKRPREQEVKHLEELQKCGFKKREDPALTHPINRLVHQTREQEIVMDQNPIVELEKIMVSDVCFYNNYLNVGEKPVDGLATPEAAHIKYFEFWSKYVNAANRAEPALETAKDDISSMPSNLGISLSGKPPITNASRVDETKLEHP